MEAAAVTAGQFVVCTAAQALHDYFMKTLTKDVLNNVDGIDKSLMEKCKERLKGLLTDRTKLVSEIDSEMILKIHEKMKKLEPKVNQCLFCL